MQLLLHIAQIAEKEMRMSCPKALIPHLLAQLLDAIDHFPGNSFIHHGLVWGHIQQHQNLSQCTERTNEQVTNWKRGGSNTLRSSGCF